MMPIKEWVYMKGDPNEHYYFFPIYVKGGNSQLYVQLYKHIHSDKIVMHLRDVIAIKGSFIESDKKDIEKLLDKYYKQNKRTFKQAVIGKIFEWYLK